MKHLRKIRKNTDNPDTLNPGEYAMYSVLHILSVAIGGFGILAIGSALLGGQPWHLPIGLILLAVPVVLIARTVRGQEPRLTDSTTLSEAWSTTKAIRGIAQSAHLKGDLDAQELAEVATTHYHALLKAADTLRKDEKRKRDTPEGIEQRSLMLKEEVQHLKDALQGAYRLQEAQEQRSPTSRQRKRTEEKLHSTGEGLNEQTRILKEEAEANKEARSDVRVKQ